MRGRRTSLGWIGWTTITYRSVMMSVAGFLLLCLVVYFIIFPVEARVTMNAVSALAGAAIEKISAHPTGNGAAGRGEQQANFTALEGSVRVKKHNGNTWVAANFNLPLEKGDVVQTGPDGIAKIVFADGTNYVVKQDSLIVVEESSINTAQQTKVAVQVTTGTVDLATSTFTQGSTSSVIVAGAQASFAAETNAQVRNDPRADEHEIKVSRGSGEVVRGGQTVKLSELDRVNFSTQQPGNTMVKTKDIGPPVLIAPANMMPVFTGGANRPLQFTWTSVAGAEQYRMRVSRTPYFSTTLLDRTVADTTFQAAPFAEGPYYWDVQSIDANGRKSVESEKNRFTIINRSPSPLGVGLELDPFVQHGHVIEVRGRTDPDARVMVNGVEVPLINADGSFRYFTRPLSAGESTITVTAQNVRGGVNTKQQTVMIQ
jgi:hypothetical protein